VVGRLLRSNAFCVLARESVRQWALQPARQHASALGLAGAGRADQPCRPTWPPATPDSRRCSRWRPRPDLRWSRWGRSRPTTGAALAQSGWERICCLCGTARTTPTTACSCSACARPHRRSRLGERASGPARSRAAHLRPESTPAAAAMEPSTGRAARSLGSASVERRYRGAQWPARNTAARSHESAGMLITWLQLIWRCVADRTAKPAPALEAEPINLAAALGRITAPHHRDPAGSHDLYFPPDGLRPRSRPDCGRPLRALESCWASGRQNPRERPAEQGVIRAAV